MYSQATTRDELIEQMIQVARESVAAGVLGAARNANMTARLPGDQKLYLMGDFTVARPEDIAVMDLDGKVVEGRVRSDLAEVLHMHADIYPRLPKTNCIIHTHSPGATAFAVARRPLPPVIEMLPRLGITRPIPVTHDFQPRGSDEAVKQIFDVVEDDTRAVLLAHHGLIVFGESVMHAGWTLFSIEDNAQLALSAAAIGGAVTIEPGAGEAAIARGKEYAKAGDVVAAEGYGDGKTMVYECSYGGHEAVRVAGSTDAEFLANARAHLADQHPELAGLPDDAVLSMATIE